MLDGWRAVSILLVLATHLLPVGPKRWHLNAMSGLMGMSLFFTLSGFLITQQLHAKHSVAAFFVRRLFRVVPLAWVYTFVAMLFVGTGFRMWVAHLCFAINYDQRSITEITGHFWSLCVEVHFYCAIGLLMAVTRFRGFLVIPVAWIGLVILRAVVAPAGTIETHLRVDEILSGSCLALAYLGYFGPAPLALASRLPFVVLLGGLVVTSHPATGVLNAFRGMVASLLIGHTVSLASSKRFDWLGHRALRYIAETSYALYVIHPLTGYGWLGSGPSLVKYTKRILTFALTFGLAHLSTYHLERPFTALGKRLATRIERRAAARRSAAGVKVGPVEV